MISDISFNPRARDGREMESFQSQYYCSVSFNPRARDGREHVQGYELDDYHVSIHAPVMDAKVCQYQVNTTIRFQSTRP